MGKNKTILETVDAETNESVSFNVTSLVSDLHHHLLNARRKATELKPYNQLSEKEQQREIDNTYEWASDLIMKAVEVVATAGQTAAHVQLDKFDFDIAKQSIKITASGKADDKMLIDMKHSNGKLAKIIIVDADKFKEQSADIEPDKDQPEMFDELEQKTEPEFSDEDETLEKEIEQEQEVETSIADIANHILEKLDGAKVFGPSFVQRAFGISYNKAIDYIDDLDEAGFIETSDQKGKYQFKYADDETAENAPASTENVNQEPDDEPAHDQETGEIIDDDQSISDFAAETTEAAKEEMEATQPADDDKIDKTDLSDRDREVYDMGSQAAIDDAGPDENPFDGGTGPFNLWRAGYDAAITQIEKVRQAGANAAAIEKPKDKNPWKKASNEARWWNEGYDRERETMDNS